MKKSDEEILHRPLDKEAFKMAKEAIKAGKKSGDLENPELIEKLVEDFKEKPATAPFEVILTASLFLNGPELIAAIKGLRRQGRGR